MASVPPSASVATGKALPAGTPRPTSPRRGRGHGGAVRPPGRRRWPGRARRVGSAHLTSPHLTGWAAGERYRRAPRLGLQPVGLAFPLRRGRRIPSSVQIARGDNNFIIIIAAAVVKIYFAPLPPPPREILGLQSLIRSALASNVEQGDSFKMRYFF